MLLAKPEIDTTEYGMKQGTFRFLIDNALWPSIEPPRGTPCGATGFVGADAGTISFLNSVSFMGAQTLRYTRGGQCPGVGILEVLCQGADFDAGTPVTHEILSIPVTFKGVTYTSAPTVILSGGDPITNASVSSRLENQSFQIIAGGTNYHVGDVLSVVGGSYDTPIQIKVDAIGTGGSIKVTDGGHTHVTNWGRYSVVPANNASLTGSPTGSGATIQLSWHIGAIVVSNGGSYFGTPTASLSGGGYTQAGTLGTPHMSNVGGGGGTGGLQFTIPWKPTDTTKDTVQFVVTPTSGGGTGGTAEVKFATTAPLPTCNYYTSADGSIYLEAVFGIYGSTGSPTPDGGVLSVGDRVLVKDEPNAYRNGVYKVDRLASPPGQLPVVTWVLQRPSDFDDASEFTTSVIVHVNAGQTLANTLWQCGVNVTTLAASDTSGGTAIPFTAISSGGTSSPGTRITIDYHVIDLHFEYMSTQKLQQANFTLAAYSMDDNGYITTDPSTGEKMLLAIDSTVGETIVTNTGTGVTSYVPITTPIPRSMWTSAVQFLGTSSRFEQVPAGQFWHITETTSIKIVPNASAPQ